MFLDMFQKLHNVIHETEKALTQYSEWVYSEQVI